MEMRSVRMHGKGKLTRSHTQASKLNGLQNTNTPDILPLPLVSRIEFMAILGTFINSGYFEVVIPLGWL